MKDGLGAKKSMFSKFIVVTQDYSGLGFATMLQDESDGLGDPRKPKQPIEVILAYKPKDDEDDELGFNQVGEGMVEKEELDELFKKRFKYRDYAWIWDGNHHSDMADKLRSEGFAVLGGHQLADKMEHDRNFGLSLIEKAGLTTPEYKEFKDVAEGISFLEENEEIAYVFKPDEPDNRAWVTTCPDSDHDTQANLEIRKFLESQSGTGTFVLQERKKGVEINVEVWLYEGTPFFSHANFESKRKYNGDWGKMVGCSQDIEFVIPLDCRIMRDTLAKLIKMPEFKDYTGFVDLNLIVADNEYYFLEFCARFGYNAHPNLFLTLAIQPLSTIVSKMLTGDVDDFYALFRAGFGASITMWIDDPVQGLPIMFDEAEETQSRFFHFDTYKDGDDYYLAGYANEVGIICAHDYDVHSAAEEVLAKFNRIHYSGHAGRTDLAMKNYQSNPEERYIACVAMKLFDVI